MDRQNHSFDWRNAFDGIQVEKHQTFTSSKIWFTYLHTSQTEDGTAITKPKKIVSKKCAWKQNKRKLSWRFFFIHRHRHRPLLLLVFCHVHLSFALNGRHASEPYIIQIHQNLSIYRNALLFVVFTHFAC